jgi:hypothetical protein
MNFFLLFCFIVHFSHCKLNEIDCIEGFLNANQGISNEECEKVVKKLSSEFLEDIRSQLSDEDSTTCILNVFDDYHITRLYFRGLVKHIRNHTEKYDEDVEESKDALVNAAKVLCTSDSKFDADFERLFNETKPSETNEYERCVQKYFIDEKIIDEEEFTFNSTGLNQTYCDQAHEELSKNFSVEDDEDEKSNTFFGLSAAKAQKCTNQKFTDLKVMQNIFKFQIIASYWSVTDAQKEKLRKSYVAARKSSVLHLFECMKEI